MSDVSDGHNSEPDFLIYCLLSLASLMDKGCYKSVLKSPVTAWLLSCMLQTILVGDNR